MRIGCLQFAPQVGDVDNNLNRADAVLSRSNPQDLDLLVLPELAFSGYNFKSLQHISPYLEPTASGITSLWARTNALKYNCVVTAGYPEKVDIAIKWPTSPEYYNSAITVNADGETIANYRKSFLYYTDETWALEGPDGFFDGHIEGLGNVAMGICKWPTKSFERMDLNPYKFESPWNAWEFAYHILHKEANLVVLSMAWLTREEQRSYSRSPKEPDMETLAYWLSRLEPVIRAETEGEIIVVLANRCGAEGSAVYAGTSCVLGIQDGEVRVYGILGRGEKELLVVDTSKPPQAKLVSEPNSSASHASNKKLASPRIRSTFSESSARTNLSVDTTLTGRTSPGPATPEPFKVLYDSELDIFSEDIISPVSPVNASSPAAYFSKCQDPELETVREALKSSIVQLQEPNAPESAPLAFVRPPSPKSRNASRTRQPKYQEPALLAHDHALPESPTIPIHDVGLVQALAFAPAQESAALAEFVHVNQESQLLTHESQPKPPLPAQKFDFESQTQPDDSVIVSPPHSRSAAPPHSRSSSLGPRSLHKSPRPRSALW